MTPLSLRLVAAERTTIFSTQALLATAKTNQHICPTTFFALRRGATTPHHGKISPPLASPEKSQRTIFKSSDRWRPTPTVAPHINLCESAHKNKKSKHNNQPNASSRSRCRRTYPRRGQPMLGRHQPPTEAQKKGEHYHAYCLFHFIIFILHHPNVILAG